MYAITTHSLGRKFGDRWAVQDLNLQVRQGEVFGLLGPNGAGKTTTMRMLSCLIAPSTGSGSVFGYDILRDRTAIRKSIGILTESPGLYESLSAEQNLEFYAKLYDLDATYAKQQITRYLRLLGLWEQRKEPCGGFSKGMKQKLSIARALLHEPSLVILDEPTSALDPEGAKQVRDFIRSLKSTGRSVILCTHNLSEAQTLCDRVAIVKRTLLHAGTPRELQQALYGRHIEIVVGEVVVGESTTSIGRDPHTRTMNDLAVLVSMLGGVGDVVVSENRLLVSTLEPEEVTPTIVRALVLNGAHILRVAEVEHTLERAYLDLVARHDADQELMPAERVA